MGYNKADLIRLSLEAIEKNNLMFQSDILAYVPFSEKTFYNQKLQEVQPIKRALEDNRIKTKNSLKAKWYLSDNPTVQIALFKLIGSEDEVHRLSGTKHEQTNTHQFIDGITVKVIDGVKNRSKPDLSEDKEGT